MLPAFLITFREVIEASLIVATILGILTKLGQREKIKTLWSATAVAAIASITFLLGGSLLGLRIQELYTGKTEKLFEGVMMITSAVFITWAVFWLHTYFGKHKLALLQKVKSTVTSEGQLALFILVFTAVFREGFEIVLFLSTIYLSTSPLSVFTGFGTGTALGLAVALSIFTATLKLPVYQAFQASTVLLILFAAGLAGRGMHEFGEAGLIPEFANVTLAFLPPAGHFVGDTLGAIFGWSRSMDSLQLVIYAAYIACMRYLLYIRPLHRTA